jgi:hypothetical protein
LTVGCWLPSADAAGTVAETKIGLQFTEKEKGKAIKQMS